MHNRKKATVTSIWARRFIHLLIALRGASGLMLHFRSPTPGQAMPMSEFSRALCITLSRVPCWVCYGLGGPPSIPVSVSGRFFSLLLLCPLGCIGNCQSAFGARLVSVNWLWRLGRCGGEASVHTSTRPHARNKPAVHPASRLTLSRLRFGFCWLHRVGLVRFVGLSACWLLSRVSLPVLPVLPVPPLRPPPLLSFPTTTSHRPHHPTTISVHSDYA